MSLLNVFDGVKEKIYKDGIHFYEQSSGPTRIMEKLGMTFERETTHKGFRVVLYAVENPANKFN